MREEIKFKFVLEHEETKEKRLTRVYTFDDFLNKTTDDVYEDFDKFLIVGKVMSTGLKDKNGKEIYEGDVVKYHDVCSDAYMLEQGMTVGKIVFYKERSQLLPQAIKTNHKGGKYITPWELTADLEIIGNIHENPELVERA